MIDAPPLDHPSASELADAFLDQLADELALAASNRRQRLVDLVSRRKRIPRYEPQLGWNPVNGEPWLAIRCYAPGKQISLLSCPGYALEWLLDHVL
jgi:hypothetical protein